MTMEQNILYRFSRLRLTQFATFEENIHDGMDVDVNSCYRFEYIPSASELCCSTTIEMMCGEMPLLKAELVAAFEIEATSASLLRTGDGITFSPDLLAQFASLSYGTMRGVLFAKTEHTPLSHIILPPANVKSLFQQPMTFDIAAS